MLLDLKEVRGIEDAAITLPMERWDCEIKHFSLVLSYIHLLYLPSRYVHFTMANLPPFSLFSNFILIISWLSLFPLPTPSISLMKFLVMPFCSYIYWGLSLGKSQEKIQWSLYFCCNFHKLSVVMLLVSLFKKLFLLLFSCIKVTDFSVLLNTEQMPVLFFLFESH